jgi:hypothetical protein
MRASVAVQDPNLRGSRKDTWSGDDFFDVELTVKSDTMSEDKIAHVVSTWASRCRIPGVRGERLALVSEVCEEVEGVFHVFVRLGTAVFYSPRTFTVDVSLSAWEFEQDLANLYSYVDGSVSAKHSKLNAEFGNQVFEVDELDDETLAEQLLDIRVQAAALCISNDRGTLRQQLLALSETIDSVVDHLD